MMVPSRQRLLARLLIASARAHKNQKGDPAAHEIPIDVAEKAIARLESAWAQPEPEIERFITNLSVGIVR